MVLYTLFIWVHIEPDIINYAIQAVGAIIPNGSNSSHLQPSLHSVKYIPGSVCARFVIGGGCFLRHVTECVIGRIGGHLPFSSLYGCSVNPR